MSHQLISLNFVSTIPSTWDWPEKNQLCDMLSTAILLDSEVVGRTLGFYKPPDRVDSIILTDSAYDQIRTMWWGHRDFGSQSPPAIPLKYFVSGFGQANGESWINVEILPGSDDWNIADT